MTERPILMSAPMVRAILAGTKTQTRRVLPTQETMGRLEYPGRRVRGWSRVNWLDTPEGIAAAVAECRYGKPGDRLWVREAFRAPPAFDQTPPRDIEPGIPLHYAADGERRLWGKLRPGMFMPRWASRITLEVTGVRVERLQDISEADAVSEGIERSGECNWRDYRDHPYNDFTNARRSYRSLWEQINGPGSWDANPWVWCVALKRIESEAAHSRRVA